MRTIPVNELARRLCVRNHPHLRTTNQVVPCGTHTMEAQRLFDLTTERGTHSFDVIRDARDEFGTPHVGARPWGPNGELVNPPADGDDQARCWNMLMVSEAGGSQCVLFNGHEEEGIADHQYATDHVLAGLVEATP